MSRSAARTNGSGKRRSPTILVVDDFEDGRELVRDILVHAGFSVRLAASGQDGLDIARALQPDLLVLDLALPSLDGWHVAKLLKEADSTRSIRILALTAHAEQRALERALVAGCDSVMTKPCVPDELVAEVRRLLGGAVALRTQEN